jgi:hypothetical protein
MVSQETITELLIEKMEYFQKKPDCRMFFKIIDEWSDPSNKIRLSYMIPRFSNEIMLFLNRQRKSRGWKDEPGPEIPMSLAQKIGFLLLNLPRRGNGKIEREGDWFFDPIYDWPIASNVKIVLKLQYNDRETKYFLNKERSNPTAKEGGVEIPIGFAKRIGIKLFNMGSDEKKKNN